jgi:ribosomal protein S18 acetylase RimI-like enzyme
VTLEFRRPTIDEASAMAALHVQCWREAYSEILPNELLNSFNDETRLPMWQSVIPNADRFVLAAYDDAKPVGFVISGGSDEKHIEDQDGHLWGLYIAVDYGRRGIGRRLIASAASDWLARGGTSMTIGVLAENIRARSFYEALGAKLVKLGTYKWDGYPLPDTVYIFENLPALIP